MLEKGMCVYNLNTNGDRFATIGAQMFKVLKKHPINVSLHVNRLLAFHGLQGLHYCSQ